MSQRAADGAAAAHGALLPRRRQSSPVNFPNLDFGVLPGAKNGAGGGAGGGGGGRRGRTTMLKLVARREPARRCVSPFRPSSSCLEWRRMRKGGEAIVVFQSGISTNAP